MEKRGQVTLFVILGIVVLAIIGSFVYYSKISSESSLASQSSDISKLPLELQNAGKALQGCIKKTSENALVELGFGSGYLGSQTSVSTINIFDNEITYLYDQGKNNVPTLSFIESELSTVIKENILDCSKSLSSIKASPVKSVKVTIKDNVNILVVWPVTFAKGSISSKMQKFNVNLDMRLKIIHSVVASLVKGQVDNNGSYCISCLIDLANQNSLNASLYFKDKSTIFKLSDTKSQINNTLYGFYYASR